MCLLAMLVQIRNVAERFKTKRTLVLVRARVCRHVFDHRQLQTEALATDFALVFARIDRRFARVLLVPLHVEHGAERFATHFAADRPIVGVLRGHMLLHVGKPYLLVAELAGRKLHQRIIVNALVHL